jgi:hypothetical protein
MPLKPLFRLGRWTCTPGAEAALRSSGDSFLVYLARHASGDWGDLCPYDKSVNDKALHSGGRLFSSYRLSDGTKVWVITESDRSVTPFLLPHEY